MLAFSSFQQRCQFGFFKAESLKFGLFKILVKNRLKEYFSKIYQKAKKMIVLLKFFCLFLLLVIFLGWGLLATLALQSALPDYLTVGEGKEVGLLLFFPPPPLLPSLQQMEVADRGEEAAFDFFRENFPPFSLSLSVTLKSTCQREGKKERREGLFARRRRRGDGRPWSQDTRGKKRKKRCRKDVGFANPGATHGPIYCYYGVVFFFSKCAKTTPCI